ncbi:HAMP domain-containing sensor histidine kinase [Kineosporia sp. NBRC 101731]|uniref:sensor histidine kinase n=1 Tax=Kineosporia sp. NBRC 101731 TaxID=3032199 RepID=UPI0024A4AF1F|nr:HAMP domain-containing sensor histidine kinase [Kineosporia sp. NBRC 101731]GLY26751.1 two-component sensor histidine kinase [Kineosporia sp. NBRC 101731]
MTAVTSLFPGPRRGSAWRPRIGVRTRILATVLVLTALGMLGAGITIVLMQRASLNERVNEALRTEVQEFRDIAEPSSGVPTDPSTGKPFTSVGALLQSALQKQAPDRDETFLTMVGGRPQFVPSSERFVNLEEEPELVAAVAALPVDAPVRLREIDTRAGRIRYAAVQVSVGGENTVGSYVIAQSLERNRQEVTQMAQRFAVVSLVSLIVVGVAGWLVAGRLLRPLRQLRATAERISHNDLTERIEVTGTDDISEIAVTFNRMLDRLEHAFRTQQEFLDDAGHELKTPITIIRGHLELMAAHDPGDVEETRALVLDELDRMARLVQDLILLAQTKRPDFVHREPVAVDELMTDVLEKAVGLADREWRLDEQTPAWIDADPQRITQGLLQLAHNAVKYTAPGQVIAFGSRAEGRTVHLWVRDGGPGVSIKDAERIFERFGRGGDARRMEGSGLGLSIVGAIAAAHDGSVALTSPPGEPGAVFTLTVPRAPVPASAQTIPLVQEVP